MEDHTKDLRELRHKQKTDIKRWRKYAEIDLENMARTYYENKMLQCSTKQQIAAIRQELVAEKINQVQMVLDGAKIEEVPGTPLFDANGCFYDPQEVPLGHESEMLAVSVATMEQVINDLERQYTARQREAERIMTEGARGAKLKMLLEHACENRVESRSSDVATAFHYHPSDDNKNQVDFNCLVIDQRHSEGQLLLKWRQRVEKLETIPAKVLCQFLIYLTEFLLKKYKIERVQKRDGQEFHLKGPLDLYISRLIYPRITGRDRVPIMISLRTQRELEHDEQFAKKCLWMRSLSQGEVGVPELFQKEMTEEQRFQFNARSKILLDPNAAESKKAKIRAVYPFASAILALNQARKHCVPGDLLHCFLEAIRKIHKGCHEYSKDSKVNVTADDLFPIIVWVVIHSGLEDINMRLGHMERCLPEHIKHRGEGGICLSLVEAAVAYICRMNPEQFKKDKAREKG